MPRRFPEAQSDSSLELPPRVPPRLSLFVALPLVLRGDLLTLFEKAASKGPLTRLDKGFFRLFQVNDESLIREILLDRHRRYRKGKLMRRLAAVTGDGLLINEGETWKRHRRLANPAMTQHRVNDYLVAMNECADLLVQCWGDLARQQPNGSASVDVLSDLSDVTLRGLLQTIFGIGFERRFGDVSDVIHTLLDELVRRGSALLTAPLSWPTPSNPHRYP